MIAGPLDSNGRGAYDRGGNAAPQLPIGQDAQVLADASLTIDGAYLVGLLSRVLHTTCGATLFGGLIYLRFVLAPATAGDNTEATLFAGRRKSWASCVGICTGLLLLSGIYNAFTIIPKYNNLPGIYHPLLGVKLLLGLFVMFVAALVAAFALLRAEITAAWPPATKLYEMVDSAKAKLAGISDLKALKIENYKVAPVGEGADAAILLNGDVVNAGDAPVAAPYVRIRLRDADGKVLRDQREPLGDTPLQPGERRSFALRFEHPEDVDTADFPVLEPIR